MVDLLYKEVTYDIRGACFWVWKALGGVFKEKAVDRALTIELKKRGRKVDDQKRINIYYEGEKVGVYVPDKIVDDKVLVELKCKEFITRYDIDQFWKYLKGSSYKLGLLVNFGPKRLEIKRAIYDKARDKRSADDPHSRSASYQRKGYITLITVLVLGAVGVAITTAVLLLGLGSSRTSFTFIQSNQARALADACAGEALQQIRDFTPFASSGNLSLGMGTCTYSVTNDGGQNRTIKTTGTVGTIIRKVKIIIDAIHPSINIASWQEVADL